MQETSKLQRYISQWTSPFAAKGRRESPPAGQPIQQLYGATDGPEGWLPHGQIDAILSSLCARPQLEPGKAPEKLPPDRFPRISDILNLLDERYGRASLAGWRYRPRIYTILRSIGALELMDVFIQQSINDISLPFDMDTLPSFVTGYDRRQSFLEYQNCVLTDARLLEMKPDDDHPGHISFETNADAHIISYSYLGQGAFGFVDQVYSRLSLKFYARKRIFRGKDSPANRRHQHYLIQEITLMKKFSHRHLVRIMGSYTDPKYIGYLMEPIADCNLHDFLTVHLTKESDYVSLRQFFGCLASAVSYLHQTHIRHRDLKPQNILVRSSQVYIADFGAAYEWTANATTHDRHAPRSPFYMAPEIGDRRPRNAASDMWSLGVVFLEMLTRLKRIPHNAWMEHLTREAASARKEIIPCKNIPALNSWLSELQKTSPALEVDNEPLVWTNSLLAAKPEHRPTAQALTKNIADSPFFVEHCCHECKEEFEDPAYLYSPQPRMGDSEEISDMELFKMIGISEPKPHISVQRSQTIEDWITQTQPENLPYEMVESYSAAPFYRQEPLLERDPFALARIPQNVPPENLGVSVEPEEELHGLGFVIEHDSGSSDSDSSYGTANGGDEESYEGEPYLVINDSGSESDDDLFVPTPTVQSASIFEKFDLDLIPEEDDEAGRDQLRSMENPSSPTSFERADTPMMGIHHFDPMQNLAGIRNNESVEPVLPLPVESDESHRDPACNVEEASRGCGGCAAPSEPPQLTSTTVHFDNVSRAAQWWKDASLEGASRPSTSLPSVPAYDWPRKSQPENGNAKPGVLSSRNLGKLNEVTSTSPQQGAVDADGQVFSPARYIEEAWHEMEKADSVATSVISNSVAQKFRGAYVKKLDKDYSWLEHQCKDGKAAAVRVLLEQGCNPGTHMKPRPKPLLLAIKGASPRHNKCVKALIDRGCNVNARFRSKTPIHWAIERVNFNGYDKLLGILLGAGAEMNEPDGEGDYPLLKIFQGVSVSEALKRHQMIALALVLHSKVPTPVDVNVRQPVSLNTALHLAIRKSCQFAHQAAAILIYRGADINAKNASGTTPLLMVANQWRPASSVPGAKTDVTREQELTLRTLLQADNIDVDARGGSLERSALHLAVAAGYVIGVELLLAKGASARVRDKAHNDANGILSIAKATMAEEVVEEIEKLLSRA